MDKSPNKDLIIRGIIGYGNRILGENLLFSAIFGSFVYNGNGQNDVDMVFVTHTLLEQRSLDSMKEEYFQIHKRFGLIPDIKFPGEYVTLADLKKSEMGYGFSFSDRVEIPLLRCGDDWNEFNDYRHHLTAIGGPTIFVGGDKHSFYKHKAQCLKTLIGVSLLYNNRRSFSLDQIVELIIGRGKDFLGFSDNSHVRNYLAQAVASLIKDLTARGEIVEDETGFSFEERLLRELNDNIHRYNNR